MSSIPKVINLCYRTSQDIPAEVVHRWRDLNPNYSITLHGNTECEEFLEREMGPEYVQYFRWIPNSAGPIKADFWRLCFLYVHGGVYADVDVVPLESIDSFLHPEVSICTCSSFRGCHGSVNPHFLACRPGMSVLLETAHCLMRKRRRRFTYWGFSCVFELYKRLKMHFPSMKGDREGIYNMHDLKLQLIQEVKPFLHRSKRLKYKNMYCSWGNTRVLLNRSESYDEGMHMFKKDLVSQLVPPNRQVVSRLTPIPPVKVSLGASLSSPKNKKIDRVPITVEDSGSVGKCFPSDFVTLTSLIEVQHTGQALVPQNVSVDTDEQELDPTMQLSARVPIVDESITPSMEHPNGHTGVPPVWGKESIAKMSRPPVSTYSERRSLGEFNKHIAKLHEDSKLPGIASVYVSNNKKTTPEGSMTRTFSLLTQS